MSADDPLKAAEAQRFIEGIYNYCDRWCERCAFITRCLHYVQLQQPEFQEMLEETAGQNQKRFEAAFGHYLPQAAEHYGLVVERWFNRNETALHQRLQKAKTGSEILSDQLLPEDVEDAIEVIRWYQFLPTAKLVSVLAVDKTEETARHQPPNDNGQIKVALIGIDRSLLAWGRVQMFWPERAREIMRFAGLLSELRLELELEFPDARDFLRPGFDEASEHVM